MRIRAIHILSLLLSLGLSLSSCESPGSSDPSSGTKVSSGGIIYDPTDLDLHYGTYIETAFSVPSTATGPFQWQVSGGALPPGLSLQQTAESSTLIFGTPLFTDRWCFVLSASNSAGPVASDQICLFGGENAALRYPKFKTVSLLSSAT